MLILDFSSTAVYAQGVGLGASKGKDIAKYTESSTSYVHLAKDAVSVECKVFEIRSSPTVRPVNDMANEGIVIVQRFIYTIVMLASGVGDYRMNAIAPETSKAAAENCNLEALLGWLDPGAAPEPVPLGPLDAPLGPLDAPLAPPDAPLAPPDGAAARVEVMTALVTGKEVVSVPTSTVK